ncbi:MAG: hypothetical protein KA285_08410, partial [Bacteroidia bacterium]|nr:hypothetical protein [Bacteroidia bacterium]
SKGRLQLNRRFSVVLICFGIASLFWFLIALSNDYNTRISIPVTYVNIPGKKVVINDLPKEISVVVKTTGFRIISFGFNKRQESIEIDVASKMKSSSVSSGFMSLATKSFLPDFNKQLGKEVTVSGFEPDSIIFNFRDKVTKAVPVFIDMKATFARQFDTSSSPFSNPAFIEVSGPPAILSKLKFVKTELVETGELRSTFKKKVGLVKNKLLTYDVSEVNITVPVEKFTEGTVDVPVNAINVSKGFSLKTFPEKIKVRYVTSLSDFNKVSPAMFDAIVDASDLESRHPDKISIQLITRPSFVRTATAEPERVDYILRKQ